MMLSSKQAALALCVLLCGVPAALAQDAAKTRLEKSPRHQEWVPIAAGERKVETFVVYPEVDHPVLAVLVIHENRGLTDWVKSVADQIAEAGYVALAPDLLSGTGPKGGGTESYSSQMEATKAIYALPPDQVTADLNATFEYARKLPAVHKKVAVAGFCWGGGQSFRFATNQPDVRAAFVFYGPTPEGREALARIQAPVYAFYAGNDARINQGIAGTMSTMKQLGNVYEPVTYEGAGHGFMRAGEEPHADPANRKARDEAWSRLCKLLEKL